MDNLSSHKTAAVRQAIKETGATTVYLPPYSLDLNPIELAFSKLKQLMRSVEHRTVRSLWTDTQRSDYGQRRGEVLPPLRVFATGGVEPL